MENTPRRSQVDVGTETALTLGQTALGFGIGLLLAGRMHERSRKTTGVTLLSVGVATALPFLINWALKIRNRPSSAGTMRRRLRSIREGAGMEIEEGV